MSDARTDGTCKQSLQVQVLEIIASEIAYHGTSDEGPTAILTALAEAGLGIIHKPKFRAKLNVKAMKYLDNLAEAEEAMAGKHALSILLKHYREMTEAANEQ